MKVKRPVFALALSLFVLGALACGAPGETSSTPSATAQPETPTPPAAASATQPETLTPPAAASAPGTNDDISASYQRRGQFVPLDNPEFIAADEATFLDADDLVLGLTVAGESRAYPIRMMTYHHIANDTIAGRPILITF